MTSRTVPYRTVPCIGPSLFPLTLSDHAWDDHCISRCHDRTIHRLPFSFNRYSLRVAPTRSLRGNALVSIYIIRRHPRRLL
eukprot:scaffold14881_cov30-Prasinocladus_malaysianus.AAC.3